MSWGKKEPEAFEEMESSCGRSRKKGKMEPD
jgi:hypothetical protein